MKQQLLNIERTKRFESILLVVVLVFLMICSQSLIAANPTATDSIKEQKADTTKFSMRKSPTKAVLLSFICPGLGQIYNESYWKAPLFIGAAGTLGYFVLYNNSHYNDYSDAYDREKQANPNSIKLDSLKSWRNYYQDNRDLSGLFLLGVYVLSAVDAYTDAHLFDFRYQKFDVSIRPDVDKLFNPAVRVRISF